VSEAHLEVWLIRAGQGFSGTTAGDASFFDAACIKLPPATKVTVLQQYHLAES
jgi:hypothetical protein